MCLAASTMIPMLRPVVCFGGLRAFLRQVRAVVDVLVRKRQRFSAGFPGEFCSFDPWRIRDGTVTPPRLCRYGSGGTMGTQPAVRSTPTVRQRPRLDATGSRGGLAGNIPARACRSCAKRADPKARGLEGRAPRRGEYLSGSVFRLPQRRAAGLNIRLAAWGSRRPPSRRDRIATTSRSVGACR